MVEMRVSRSHFSAVRLLTLLGVGLASGCLPMTFSNEGSIDFDRYERVYVTPILDPDGYRTDADAVLGAPARGYLISALVEDSGFSMVTGDPSTPVDLILEVRLDFWSEAEVQTDVYDDGTVVEQTSDEFVAHAYYRATTPQGMLVLSGEEETRDEDLDDAIEDVLDMVVHEFLKPYRI